MSKPRKPEKFGGLAIEDVKTGRLFSFDDSVEDQLIKIHIQNLETPRHGTEHFLSTHHVRDVANWLNRWADWKEGQ